MKHKNVCVGIVLLCASVSWARTFSSIDYPGAVLTIAYGINKSGEIVGTYNDASGVTHGFLLSGGSFSTIDYPGATLSVAVGVNDAGLILGQFNDTAGSGHGFAWQNGTFYRLPDDGQVFDTAPVSISNSDRYVGFTVSRQQPYVFSGFEFAQKRYTPLNFPGANFSVALGISPSGKNSVGSYNLNYPIGMGLGYLYASGIFTTIQVPNSTETQAVGINDAGIIVGEYFVSGSTNSHGFVKSPGGYITIDYPGAVQTYPSNLNDLDDVVGWYIDSSGVTHGYMMTK